MDFVTNLIRKACWLVVYKEPKIYREVKRQAKKNEEGEKIFLTILSITILYVNFELYANLFKGIFNSLL